VATAAGDVDMGDHGPRLPGLVLVAEDDEVNVLIVGAYLDSLGVRYERVADGKQAVSRALRETDRPELVLMDCRMPVMDGLAATADIRRQERILGLSRLPIVALTATATEADHQACLAVGMDQVITKPFTPTQLAEALRGAGQLRLGR
jgi:CheY-like chemotaxis protein